MIKKIVSEAIEKNQKQHQQIKDNLEKKELVRFNVGGVYPTMWGEY